MSADIVAGLSIFVVSILLLYFGRHKTTRTGRLLIVAGMIGSAAFLSWRVSLQDMKFEAVFHPEAVKFESVPILVWFDVQALDGYEEPLRQAVKTWNSRIGCEVLSFAEFRQDARVLVQPFDGTECGSTVLNFTGLEDDNKDAAASVWFCHIGRIDGRAWVDIQTRKLDEVTLAHRVFLHELGHALGLAHDDDGAMASRTVKREFGDPPDHLLPNNKDVEHLRARYCPH